jgi:hypothetical protein
MNAQTLSLDDPAGYLECPYCREQVRAGAALCPHCRSEQPHITEARSEQQRIATEKRQRGWFIFLAVVAAAMVAIALWAGTISHPG